jgi:hypothetical protein
MAIQLSDITFTDEDDIVPVSGVDQIFNPGIANTLAGNDLIIGTSTISDFNPVGINNFFGFINTGDGDDTLIGTVTGSGFGYGIQNYDANLGTGGVIDTGAGKDTIIAIGPIYGIYQYNIIKTGSDDDIITATGGDSIVGSAYGAQGILNGGFIDTGDGHDTITGIVMSAFGSAEGYANSGIYNISSIDSGDGDDTITGIATNSVDFAGSFIDFGINNTLFTTIDTGNGSDIITGIGAIGIENQGTINTGNGEDSIITQGKFLNSGVVFLENDDDSIIADACLSNRAIENFNAIDTGDGNDTITSTGVIYNQGIINTGNGDDSIIVNGGFDGLTGNVYGIYNNGGAINMGDGNDSIIANEGFQSGPNSSGAWFLGEGDDYIKGYGSGDFYGGNGNDTLELTPGTYTVGIWGEGGESPIFTKGNQLMITSEFEQLKAGSTIYDFTSLTAGQIITVA